MLCIAKDVNRIVSVCEGQLDRVGKLSWRCVLVCHT